MPSVTPRVPLEIRRQARSVLKHYPGAFDMEQTRKACYDAKPGIWGEPEDDE